MPSKKRLQVLYCKRQLSMLDVAQELGTTHATVLYWLKKYNTVKRSRSESAYAKLKPNGDPFRIRNKLSQKQQELMQAGLLLYWAEGSKANREITQLGNLDPRMLQVFMRFLREICQVNERRLRLSVQVHDQFSDTTAQRFWVRILRLPKTQVHVYRHMDPRSKVHKQWSKYGIARLEFPSTKFKQWLDSAIDVYIEERMKIEITVGGTVLEHASDRAS